MEMYTQRREKSKRVFVGIDAHMLRWHVTLRSEDGEDFSRAFPGEWDAVRKLLDRYRGYENSPASQTFTLNSILSVVFPEKSVICQ